MLLQPKNWAVFQHYKDRCPPWIKLHRDLLNDRTFMRLPIASKALAPMLWLLASESKDGIFDGSMDELVFRLHITEKDYQLGVKPLIDNGFFVVASGVLAERLQDAIPETERETEKEVETKKEKKATSVACPDSVSQQVWDDWMTVRKEKKAKTLTETGWNGFVKQVENAGWTLEQAISHCCLKQWVGFEASWVAPKPTLADIARVTVPPSNQPDPALEKIKADAKKAAPIPLEVLARMAELRKGTA